MSQWSGSVLLLLCSHHGDIVYSVLLRVLFDHFAFALIKIFSGIVFVVRICANFGNLGTCLVFQDYGLRWSSEQIRFRTHWSRKQQCLLNHWVILCSIGLVGGLWTAVCYFEWKQGEWTVPVSIPVCNWAIWVFRFCMGPAYNSGKDFGFRWRSEQVRFRTNWSRHFIPTAVSTGSLNDRMQHWIGWWSLDCRVLSWMKAGRVDCSCFNTTVQLNHLRVSVLYESSIQLR
jgi:hypothetical protein